MTRHIKPAGVELRAIILALAARPEGFSLKYDKGDREPKPMETVCVWLENHGEVIKAKHGAEKRYFVQAADAEAYAVQRQPPYIKIRPEKTRFAANVEIVHTAKTRYIIVPTPKPRFVAIERLAFQHGY